MTEDNPSTALVHDWLTGMRGGEKVLEAFAARFPAAPIYTLFHFPGSVSRAIESHPVRTSFLQRAPGLKRHYRRYLPLFPKAIESFDMSGFDLVISSSHCVAKGVIPGPDTYHLCYSHTPMRYAWDQEHAYFPKRTGPAARLRGLILARLRIWDAASAGRVDHFVANSNFVAQRIERYYGRESEVLHPPVDTDFFTPGEGAEGEYCLMVAALAPYKRVDLGIAACERLGLELRVVGDGPDRERLARQGGGRARLLGRVDDETLRSLYRGARCFLQPGVEDFGISSVEALACGCPVVALGRGGVLDIVSDGEHGVLYGEENAPEALTAAIDKSGKIGFNQLNLNQRAAEFAIARFEERLQSMLSSRLRNSIGSQGGEIQS
ncbi:MAG: glycosyltransferase family 4 protein [Acidobacteria bacterium]|nr:MAG: glycosyltransferase family 4 protein [Acidobacteriota bacterium]